MRCQLIRHLLKVKALLKWLVKFQPFSFGIPTHELTLYRCNFHIDQEEDGRFTLTSFIDDLCPRKRRYESLDTISWSIFNQLKHVYGIRSCESSYVKDWVEYKIHIKASGETHFRPNFHTKVKLIITYSLNIKDQENEEYSQKALCDSTTNA